MADASFNVPASGAVILPGTFTVATLPTPSVSYLDTYARVTDLFGEKRDLVLCSQGPSGYFWQPVRPIYAKSLDINAVSSSLTPLAMPSVIYLTGTLAANQTLTFSTTNAWPGASFEIAMTGALGLFGLTLAGLNLGATLSLLLNGRKRVFFDGSTNSWKEF